MEGQDQIQNGQLKVAFEWPVQFFLRTLKHRKGVVYNVKHIFVLGT